MTSTAENVAGSWVGVAISRTEIVAFDSRLKAAGSAMWRLSLEAPSADSVAWPSLATALRTLKQQSRETKGHLAVALMPTIAETRRVDVPPLSDDEIEAVLSRNASRYFIGAQGAQLVGVVARAKADVPGAVAGAAPAWIIRLITAAAREAGWTLELIAPAEAAWSVAATKAFAAGNGDVQLLMHQPEQTHVLTLSNGSLTNLRKFRSAVQDAGVFLESSPSSRLLAAGDPSVRKQWIGALGAKALSVTLPANVSSDVGNDPALLAAAFIVDVRTLLFRTEEMRIADRNKRNRVAYSLFGAAAILYLGAAGLQLWDVERELAAVQAKRAALTPQLATTLLGRATVETVSGQLAMLAASERESPQWSNIIADFTKHLPLEAHLKGFRGWADSVRFDGLAEKAADVYPALAKAETFGGIKAAAAVRLEPQPDGSTLEKFTLVAKLKSSKPAVPSPARATSDSSTRPAGRISSGGTP